VTVVGFQPETVSIGPTPPARRRRRWWPWLLSAAVLVVVVLTAMLAAWLIALFRPVPEAAQISIQGQDLMWKLSRVLTDGANELVQTWPWLGEVDWNLSFDGLSVGALTLGLLALFIGAALVVLGVLTVVPLVVLAGLMCALLAAFAGLLLAAGAVALSLSPLWLPVLGLWGWRRRKPVAMTSAPTAAAQT
jgi:hypothetical protein